MRRVERIDIRMHPAKRFGQQRWDVLYDMLRQRAFRLHLLLPLQTTSTITVPKLLGYRETEATFFHRPKYQFDPSFIAKVDQTFYSEAFILSFVLDSGYQFPSRHTVRAIRDHFRRYERTFLAAPHFYMAVPTVEGFAIAYRRGFSIHYTYFDIRPYINDLEQPSADSQAKAQKEATDTASYF